MAEYLGPMGVDLHPSKYVLTFLRLSHYDSYQWIAVKLVVSDATHRPHHRTTSRNDSHVRLFRVL